MKARSPRVSVPAQLVGIASMVPARTLLLLIWLAVFNELTLMPY